MPHSKLSQPGLLLIAIILLIAVIVVAFLRHVPTQSEEATSTIEQTANTAKSASDNADFMLSQSVARSQNTVSSQGAHPTPSGEHSLDLSNNIAPQTAQTESSEKQHAVAAFHRSLQCHVASNRIKSLQSQIAACDSLGNTMDDVCRRNIKQAEADIRDETARLAGCSTVPAIIEKAYFDSVSRAAELGNSDAQVCYVQGDFFSEIDRQQMEQYKDNALNYIQLGLERGDWRIVSLLATRNVDYIGRLGELALDNPYDIFRMNRLLRHGATGDYGHLLDLDAQDLAVRLSKAKLDSAIAWAEQEYKQYFLDSPALSLAPTVCTVADLNPQPPNQ